MRAVAAGMDPYGSWDKHHVAVEDEGGSLHYASPWREGGHHANCAGPYDDAVASGRAYRVIGDAELDSGASGGHQSSPVMPTVASSEVGDTLFCMGPGPSSVARRLAREERAGVEGVP